MIPSEELEQWEEITSKTPGLWRSVESGGNGEGLFVETLGEVSIDVIDTADYDELNTYCQAIVTAHNALPRLLQEVMELQAKVTGLHRAALKTCTKRSLISKPASQN